MNSDNAALEILDSERKNLERKLADIRKAIRTLRDSGTSADDGDGNHPTTSDVALDVLRNSKVPMTARQVAEKVAEKIEGITEGAVSASITRLKNKGLIVQVSESSPKRWIVASGHQPSGGHASIAGLASVM